MKQHKQQGFTIVGTAIVIVILVVVGLIGWLVIHKNHNDKLSSSSKAGSSNVVSGQSGSQGSSTPLSSGTDNQSLANDLSSINSNQNTSNQDANNTNGALNDQQSEISVPTN